MKKAVAYLLKDKIYIQAMSITTVGVGQLDGEVFTAAVDDRSSIGEAVIKAINNSKKNIPHPTQEELKMFDQDDLLLNSMKMKTWNAMMKASKSVYIELIEEEVIFTPERFLGTRGDNKGYRHIEDKKITSPIDFESLGKGLLEAFKFCE